MRRTTEGMALAAIGFVVVCLLLYANTTRASWEHPPQPKPAQDIADALAQLPRKVAEDYGTSDRTLVMFNIAALRDIAVKQDERIKVLEGEVAILARLKLQELRGIVDPNEVAK